MKVYLIGSLRNPKIPELGNKIRKLNYNVFDNWWGAGCHFCGHSADESYQKYEEIRNREYKEVLNDVFVEHIFEFDRKHLVESDVGILVLPAGKSAHIELGVLVGMNKTTYVLFDKEPERFDFMYRFCTDVFMNEDDLLLRLQEIYPWRVD